MKQLNELHLFAGAGGGILGGILCGHTPVCAVEIEPYCRKVLLQRQRDGVLPHFPIWDDVRTFDGRPWREKVDIVCGGFPCQDISAAGKGAGIEGERSGLWSEMSRIIGEVRPRFALVENSPILTSRGLGRVLGDLAAMGYDARWGVLGAIDAGAPHKRDRIWIVANATGDRWGQGDKDSARRREGMGARAKQGSRNDRRHVADSAGSQDHAKRGDCECGRNAMERHNQAAQQDIGATDHDGSCGCGGTLADSNCPQCQGNKRSKRIKEEHADASSTSWWSPEPDVGRVAHGVASRVDRLKAIGNGQVPAVARLAWNTLKQ